MISLTAGQDNMPISNMPKEQRYRMIAARLKGIAAAEPDALANLCNFVSFLYFTMGDVNWVGLYIMRGGDLVLGPFAGKPACSRISAGKGVCGTCAASQEAQIVPDVKKFPGHIACDDASRSELVLPIFTNGRLWGVLDMDSPEPGRFDTADCSEMGRIARLIEEQASNMAESIRF